MELEILFVLFLFFVFVTLVGHTIWLILSWIIQSIFGTEKKPHTQICPWCEHATAVEKENCGWCNRAIHSPAARHVADLAGMRRQIQRWKEAGNITEAAGDRLLAMVEDERRKALQLPPLAAQAAAPPLAEPKPEAKPKEEAVEAVLVEVIDEKEGKVPPKVSESVPGATPPAQPVTQSAEPSEAQRATQPRVPQPAVAKKPAARSAAPGPRKIKRPPQKTWRELVHGFLEERDIPVAELIGVLVGGMFIVASAVLLLISFWDTLQEYPVLKFSSCAAAVVISTLVGLYAYHRWQLPTSGRGLLTISLLLVPISFLSVAGFGSEWTVVVAELLALALFGYLLVLVGRVLVPDQPWHLSAAVLGPVA